MVTGPDGIPAGMTREEYREWLNVTYGRDAEMAHNLIQNYSKGIDVTDSINTPEPWWKRFLNPVFRRWAYGVSVAATGVLAGVLNKPEILPLMLPLILALFFVDSNGDAK